MDYKAGGYIQIEIPECEVNYKDIDISAHPEEHPEDSNKFKLEWDKFNLWNLKMKKRRSFRKSLFNGVIPCGGKRSNVKC